MIVVTLLTGQQSSKELLTIDHYGWLARSRESLPPVREHPFENDVPWWANAKLWAVAMFAICLYLVFGVFW